MLEESATYNPTAYNVRRVSFARLLMRALGIAFLPLLSLFMAFYAFIALPQVQDLFFDVKTYAVQGIVYWIGFYLIGICFWALPMVFAARLLLLQNFDAIGVDTEERFRFIIFRLPALLAVFAFVAVFLGIYAAGSNLPTDTGTNIHEKVLRSRLEWHLFWLFVATAIVLLLVIVRNIFLLGYGRKMQHLEIRHPERFKRTLVRFEKLARNHTHDFDKLDLHLTALKPAFLSAETWVTAQRIKVFMWRYMQRFAFIVLVLVAIHFISYSDLVEGWGRTLEQSASEQTNRIADLVFDALSLKRAVFLNIIFGAWLPFLGFLALMSNRHQFPVITTALVVAIMLTLFISDGHDARILTLPPQQKAKAKPVTFNDAVVNWKEASGWNAKGCNNLTEGAPELADCPRPIIAIGEGGGSRAAYMFASMLGHLEDRSLDSVGKVPGARPFHEQLFAISSVSGSAVGAAFFVSALKTHEAVRNDKAKFEALKKAIDQQRLWFVNVATGGGTIGDFITYKDALQAALSNDFLTPVMAGYLSRDVPTISRLPMIMDRAGIIETTWEDAFNEVYGLNRTNSPLSAPLMSFAPQPGSWTPLLFFNATSIETGRRIIATPIEVSRDIFVDSYDAHELLCSEKNEGLRLVDRIARILPSIFSPMANAECTSDNHKPVSIDFRLSTAVGLSARSPFVSPHGNLRDRTGQIVDSAVDGGYFDNSGAVTAVEIAKALKNADVRLRPFILQISNEPEWFRTICFGQSSERFLQDEADFKPLGTLGNIFTVNATRVARAYETIVESPGQVRLLNGGKLRSDAQIYVCPQPKENFLWEKLTSFAAPKEDKSVSKEDATYKMLQRRDIQQKTQEQATLGWKSISLSWWLSPPLQAFLDGQLYAHHNTAARECVLSLLRPQSATDQEQCQ